LIFFFGLFKQAPDCPAHQSEAHQSEAQACTAAHRHRVRPRAPPAPEPLRTLRRALKMV
jgi:hypothetical protein